MPSSCPAIEPSQQSSRRAVKLSNQLWHAVEPSDQLGQPSKMSSRQINSGKPSSRQSRQAAKSTRASRQINSGKPLSRQAAKSTRAHRRTVRSTWAAVKPSSYQSRQPVKSTRVSRQAVKSTQAWYHRRRLSTRARHHCHLSTRMQHHSRRLHICIRVISGANTSHRWHGFRSNWIGSLNHEKFLGTSKTNLDVRMNDAQMKHKDRSNSTAAAPTRPPPTS